jgi:hypothetical protein
MMRKLIAVAAVSGSLALGAVGVIGSGTAGAATPATPATHATACAKAEKVAARITTLESKATVWLPKAQANEAKATAADKTKLAAAIGRRISRVQKLETRGNTLLGKISAKCGSATSAS